MKNRVPTQEELEIIRRNGIDTEGVAVSYRDEDTIHLLRFKTRDTIIIRRGDKQW